MQQMPIDNMLMALNILLASPESYIQINSRHVDVWNIWRADDEVCTIQEMRNLSSIMDTAVQNQIKINDKMNQILTGLQTTVNRLSTDHTLDFDKPQEGEVMIKLPNLPFAFPVRSTKNKYGENWLLIAHRDANSKLFAKTTTESVENSVGDFEGEYFIGFRKLRAITESYMCELLIVLQSNNGAGYYRHYDAVVFGADNKVKVLGLYTTNGTPIYGLTEHVQSVNQAMLLNSKGVFVTIYLRRTTLDTVTQLKNII